eukprot:4297697-Pleurochrysis_carterae.AAC.1
MEPINSTGRALATLTRMLGLRCVMWLAAGKRLRSPLAVGVEPLSTSAAQELALVRCGFAE